jgi:hypothetical protein
MGRGMQVLDVRARRPGQFLAAKLPALAVLQLTASVSGACWHSLRA